MIQRIILSLLLLCGFVSAQQQATNYTTLQFDQGATLPAVCQVPGWYLVTTSPQTLYICKGTTGAGNQGTFSQVIQLTCDASGNCTVTSLSTGQTGTTTGALTITSCTSLGVCAGGGVGAITMDMGVTSNTTLKIPGSGAATTYLPLISNTGTASSPTSASSETNLKIVTIPGGVLAANSGVTVSVLYKFTGTANTKTAVIRVSGTSGDTSTGFVMLNQTSIAANLDLQATSSFWNANSVSAQVASVGAGFSSTAVSTGTVNTANPVYLNFNCSTVNAGDACSVIGYTVTINY